MFPRKLVFLVVPWVAGFVGCANQTTQPDPQTGPPGVDIEFHGSGDDTESNRPDATAANDGADSSAEESSKPNVAREEQPSKSRSEATRKSCSGLKKTDCEVQMGCAWSTDKVCVEQS